MHVFISYAKRDTYNLAQRIRRELEAIPGVTAWMDESLQTGKSWAKQIQNEIVNCDCFVVLLSPDVNRDETPDQAHSFVINEIQLAQELKKPIIPITAQRTFSPLQIATLPSMDFTQDEQVGMQQLLADIKKYLPQSIHEAKATIPSIMTTPMAPLAAWNPASWLRLFWWLLITPAQYHAYVVQYGKQQLKPTASALSSTLIWIPIGIVLLGGVLETIPFDVEGAGNIPAAIWLVGVTLGWLITIAADASLEETFDWMVGIALFVAIIMSLGVMGGVSFGMVEIVAVGVALIIALGIVADMTDGIAGGVVFGLIIGMVIEVWDGGGRFERRVKGFVEGIVVLGLMLVVMYFVRDSHKTGRASIGNYLIFLSLLISYAALIYIFLLGGYQTPA
jgi:hypothetical protein